MIDHNKLRELADTLTEDQRQLLREGLAGGADVDAETLAASLKRLDSELMFLKLATESRGSDKPTAAAAAAAGTGAGDFGVGDTGIEAGFSGSGKPKPKPKPKPEPPLTRW
jgi:hypothetical protein